MLETQETQFRSLGREDPLEWEVGTHSSILAWKIPCTEKVAWQAAWDRRVGHNRVTEQAHTCFLYNPRDDAKVTVIKFSIEKALTMVTL